jgi:hypothetical protein
MSGSSQATSESRHFGVTELLAGRLDRLKATKSIGVIPTLGGLISYGRKDA